MFLYGWQHLDQQVSNIYQIKDDTDSMLQTKYCLLHTFNYKKLQKFATIQKEIRRKTTNDDTEMLKLYNSELPQ